MNARTETQSLETDADPDAVYEVLVDPRHIPRWAPAFADSVVGDAGRGWQAVKSGASFALRIVAARQSRTVDYLREVAPGREGGAFVRVLPRPEGGSVILMTLPLRPGADVKGVAGILSDELQALARLAQES